MPHQHPDDREITKERPAVTAEILEDCFNDGPTHVVGPVPKGELEDADTVPQSVQP